MKKVYRRLAALSMAAAALSSCSRSAYTFNNQVPAYLGTTHATAIASAAAPTPSAVVPAPIPAARATVAAPVPAPRAAAPAKAIAEQPADAAASQLASSTLATKAAKPTLAQRLVLHKVTKQLAKRELRQQNTAGVAKTAAKGSSLTVAIIGLAALIVGLIISSGLLITLGSIVLVVGIVLLILSIL